MGLKEGIRSKLFVINLWCLIFIFAKKLCQKWLQLYEEIAL